MDFDQIVNNPNIALSWDQSIWYSPSVGWIQSPKIAEAKYKLIQDKEREGEGETGGETGGEGGRERGNPVIHVVSKPKFLTFKIKVKTQEDYEAVKQFLESKTQESKTRRTLIDIPKPPTIQKPRITLDNQEKKNKLRRLMRQLEEDEEVQDIYSRIRAFYENLRSIAEQYSDEARDILPQASFKFTCNEEEYEREYWIRPEIPYHLLYYIEDVISDYNVTFSVSCLEGSEMYQLFDQYDLIVSLWPDFIPKTRLYVTESHEITLKN